MEKLLEGVLSAEHGRGQSSAKLRSAKRGFKRGTERGTVMTAML